MLAIDEAKLPPPNPAVAATTIRVENGVSGWPRTQASASVGISRSSDDTTVQLRPPTMGTAKVYGMRRNAPTPEATARSVNPWFGVSAQPLAPARSRVPSGAYVP